MDAYDASERAIGLYYCLEEKLQFSFTVRCITLRENIARKAVELFGNRYQRETPSEKVEY